MIKTKNGMGAWIWIIIIVIILAIGIGVYIWLTGDSSGWNNGGNSIPQPPALPN